MAFNLAEVTLRITEKLQETLPVVGVAIVSETPDLGPQTTYHTILSRTIKIDWSVIPTSQQQTDAETAITNLAINGSLNDRREKTPLELLAELRANINTAAEIKEAAARALTYLAIKDGNVLRGLGIDRYSDT